MSGDLLRQIASRLSSWACTDKKNCFSVTCTHRWRSATAAALAGQFRAHRRPQTVTDDSHVLLPRVPCRWAESRNQSARSEPRSRQGVLSDAHAGAGDWVEALDGARLENRLDPMGVQAADAGPTGAVHSTMRVVCAMNAKQRAQELTQRRALSLQE